MSMTNYSKNQILNHILTAVAYASPNASLHIGLFTADPTDAFITTNELDVVVNDTAYTRQPITFGASANPDDGQSLNDVTATFAAVVYGSGGVPYNITHVGVFDALTGGNLLFHTPLSAPVLREVSKTLTFDVGTIKITQDLGV